MDKTLSHPFLVGFSNAMDVVFLVGAFVLVAGVVLSLMLKEVPLRTMSGQEARAAAEAERSAADTPSAATVPGAAASAAPVDVAPLAPRHDAP
jgi:hypothetical protein